MQRSFSFLVRGFIPLPHVPAPRPASIMIAGWRRIEPITFKSTGHTTTACGGI
jgi:hypothetical protein